MAQAEGPLNQRGQSREADRLGIIVCMVLPSARCPLYLERQRPCHDGSGAGGQQAGLDVRHYVHPERRLDVVQCT